MTRIAFHNDQFVKFYFALRAILFKIMIYITHNIINTRVTFILSVNFAMLNYIEINVCFVQSFSSSISRFTMRHDTPVSDEKRKDNSIRVIEPAIYNHGSETTETSKIPTDLSTFTVVPPS